MKNQVTMMIPKETNKALITDIKEMEIYELSEKEFRIITLRKKLQEHTYRKLNEIKKTIHRLKFNKETEMMKKITPEILELKNTISELKNLIESFKSRLDH